MKPNVHRFMLHGTSPCKTTHLLNYQCYMFYTHIRPCSSISLHTRCTQEWIMESWQASHECSPLQWRHNGNDSVSNHQAYDCLLSRLFRLRSKKTSKLRVTGLCVWNSPGTGEFPAQMASNAENVSIWWRHHAHKMPLSQNRDSFFFKFDEIIESSQYWFSIILI